MTSGCGVLEVHKDQETDALASRPSPASQQLCDFKSVTDLSKMPKWQKKKKILSTAGGKDACGISGGSQ